MLKCVDPLYLNRFSDLQNLPQVDHISTDEATISRPLSAVSGGI